MKVQKMFLSGLAVVCVVLAGFSVNCVAQSATEEMFTEGEIEYHFLLNDTINVLEDYMPALPAQIADQLAPMYLVETEGDYGTGMYVDTPDRLLRKQNLILRVKQKKITLKARGKAADAVLDLEKCDKKKYEIDYVEDSVYSISSDIKFKEDDFDVNFVNVTPTKLYAFIEERCPSMYEYIKPITENPQVRIPGVARQYEFKASLQKDHPLAGKIEVEFTIWFLPPTDKTVVELAYSGDAADREELDKLRAETVEFLKSRGLLSPDQMSKTQIYFNTFLGE